MWKLPPTADGSKGVLVKNLHLSCDPYMRSRMWKLPPTAQSTVASFQPASGDGTSVQESRTQREAHVEASPVSEGELWDLNRSRRVRGPCSLRCRGCGPWLRPERQLHDQEDDRWARWSRSIRSLATSTVN
ncbi:hypothetical protein NL676_018919 [Syzygium grande]|nr:hypothetical protein NL676_018919 [Syzygium grande]